MPPLLLFAASTTGGFVFSTVGACCPFLFLDTPLTSKATLSLSSFLTAACLLFLFFLSSEELPYFDAFTLGALLTSCVFVEILWSPFVAANGTLLAGLPDWFSAAGRSVTDGGTGETCSLLLWLLWSVACAAFLLMLSGLPATLTDLSLLLVCGLPDLVKYSHAPPPNSQHASKRKMNLLLRSFFNGKCWSSSFSILVQACSS